MASPHRTRLRSAYIQAVTDVGGCHAYDHTDDAFMQSIDNRLDELDKRGKVPSLSNASGQTLRTAAPRTYGQDQGRDSGKIGDGQT